MEAAFGLDVPGAGQTEIRVFTTRPDTIFGVTFVIGPMFFRRRRITPARLPGTRPRAHGRGARKGSKNGVDFGGTIPVTAGTIPSPGAKPQAAAWQ